MALAEKFETWNFKLASCQDDIDETVNDLHMMCDRVYAIQVRGQMSTGSNNDSMLWVEDLVSATRECQELKEKLMRLKEQRALLCKFLSVLETA